ncbi:MAG: TIM barrel protein, partial [Planctomycetota bacterium]|nr:TIM barrel protein [Planctomycetota bacterium]
FNGDDEFSLIDPDHKTDYLDFIKESISMALKLRSKSLTIHSNALDSKGKVRNRYNNIPDAVKLATMKATLKKCTTLAEKAKITLNLEALNIITDHVGNYLSSTQLAADLTRKIASPNLKILYDVYHMQLNEGNLVNNLVANIDQIGHIHVADVPGRHEPGTGEINYPFIFSTLKKLRYSRLVGFELFPRQSSKEAVKAIQKSLT